MNSMITIPAFDDVPNSCCYSVYDKLEMNKENRQNIDKFKNEVNTGYKNILAGNSTNTSDITHVDNRCKNRNCSTSDIPYIDDECKDSFNKNSMIINIINTLTISNTKFRIEINNDKCVIIVE